MIDFTMIFAAFTALYLLLLFVESIWSLKSLAEPFFGKWQGKKYFDVVSVVKINPHIWYDAYEPDATRKYDFLCLLEDTYKPDQIFVTFYGVYYMLYHERSVPVQQLSQQYLMDCILGYKIQRPVSADRPDISVYGFDQHIKFLQWFNLEMVTTCKKQLREHGSGNLTTYGTWYKYFESAMLVGFDWVTTHSDKVSYNSFDITEKNEKAALYFLFTPVNIEQSDERYAIVERCGTVESKSKLPVNKEKTNGTQCSSRNCTCQKVRDEFLETFVNKMP